MRKIDYFILEGIVLDIKNNKFVTEIALADKYFCTERTIRRYIKILKDNNKIKLVRNGKERFWIVH